MVQNLEKYLEEISHYLAVKDNAREILDEIRSHILEKTEDEFGTITEDAIGKTISAYGTPQQVAAKYLEGVEVISPIIKRHLFLYTAILFSFHVILIIVAFLFHFSMIVFPFLYIPKMDGGLDLFYVPAAFVYDLGLVSIFLYFVTQRKKEFRLPWPKFFANRESVIEMKKPRIAFLSFLIFVYALFITMLLRFGTLFFASMNDLDRPMPLFGPDASIYYSTLFLIMLGCEIVAYAIRFVNRSRWVDLVKNMAILFLLQLIWNSPVKADFVSIPGIDLQVAATAFVFLLTAIVILKFLKSLILVGTKQFGPKR